MRDKSKSILSSPISYDGNDFRDKMHDALNHFSDIFLKKEVKPKINNKDIFFEMSKKGPRFVLKYPIAFLHLISIDEISKYNLFPCYNDIAYENCENQCHDSQMTEFRIINRSECLYRLNRIHWIKEIIDLANKNHSLITKWEEKKKNQKGYDKQLFIRYNCGLDDYIIILNDRPKKNDYFFKTAYPVVNKSTKRKFDRNKKTGNR